MVCESRVTLETCGNGYKCISIYHRGVLLKSIHSTIFKKKKASDDCNYVCFFHEDIVPGCMRTLVGHFFIIDQNQCTIYIMATIGLH